MLVLHFRTDQPASSSASIHTEGCRHANLKPRSLIPLNVETVEDAKQHPEVLDLEARDWPVSIAPCCKKTYPARWALVVETADGALVSRKPYKYFDKLQVAQMKMQAEHPDYQVRIDELSR